jgi:hypothetical protein
MSWFEAGLAALAAVGLATAAALLVMRLRQARGEVDRLRREVAVFAEASTRVADTLDRVLSGSVPVTDTVHVSRRYLLGEAQKAIAGGESVDAVGLRLRLSHDEIRLLRCVLPGSATPVGPGPAGEAAPGTQRGRSRRSWAA